MKILQLNCYSYLILRKLLEDYADLHKIDLVVLSETWVSDEKTTFKNQSNSQWKSKISPRGGVAILPGPDVKCIRKADLEENNECMWCQVQISSKQCLICSVYIPPKHKKDLMKLCQKLNSVDDKKPLLIAGDFNARSQFWDPQLIPSGDPAWQMGDLLIHAISEHNLLIHNNGIQHSFRKNMSALLMSLSLEICPSKYNGQQTSIVFFKLIIMSSLLIYVLTIIDHKVKKWDFKNTDWNLWRTELDKLTLDWSIFLPDDVTPNEAYTSFTSTILDCAEKVIPKKVISNIQNHSSMHT